MRNLFKTYDVQFGSCNILRACWGYHYYWRYTEYPFLACLDDECSCLLIDAGTIIKDEAVHDFEKFNSICHYFISFVM